MTDGAATAPAPVAEQAGTVAAAREEIVVLDYGADEPAMPAPAGDCDEVVSVMPRVSKK